MLAIAVFTNRGRDRLIAEGGTQAWVLNPERARKLTYVVCAQKRNDGDWGQPTHKQGQGFLIGKISSMSPLPSRAVASVSSSASARTRTSMFQTWLRSGATPFATLSLGTMDSTRQS